MSAYNELVKNFEKIRKYLREFYVYGFKTREDYKEKSSRSYDDERRRVESWLGDYMKFIRSSEGKSVFISIDSRNTSYNPLYKSLKSKSFTDGDITLHFIFLDIFANENEEYSLAEIMEKVDTHLSCFTEPLLFDESTIRKKLKEYVELGIIVADKKGKKIVYRRTKDVDVSQMLNAIHYFSEVSPCGALGSFMLDRDGYTSNDASKKCDDIFAFKHHYITSAIDSNILAALFIAMQEKKIVTIFNANRKRTKNKEGMSEPREHRVIPLRIMMSVQSGRQHLVAYSPSMNGIKTFRVDYISKVKLEEVTPRFDELREELNDMQAKTWGITFCNSLKYKDRLEEIDFTVKINPGEEYIIRRMEREKRVGTVIKIDDFTYKFSAKVYDTGEMKTWIRTFLGKIVDFNCSNKIVEDDFKNDIKKMYKMYGIEVE